MRLPEELKELANKKRWVLFRLEKTETKINKIPYDPNRPRSKADTSNPKTWANYETAFNALQNKNNAGIGLILGGGLTGIDLDNCFYSRADGRQKIKPYAKEIIEALDSYTEKSPSGNGIHILINASLPETTYRTTKQINKTVQYNSDPVQVTTRALEVYSPKYIKESGRIEGGRFFTVTGNIYGKARPIANRQKEIENIIIKYGLQLEKIPEPAENKNKTRAIKTREYFKRLNNKDEAILKRAFNSNKIDKSGYIRGAYIRGLFYAEPNYLTNDWSSDIYSLVFYIALYSRDKEQIDRIIRQSALFKKDTRGKWDIKHYSNNETYGEHIIKEILSKIKT